MATPSTALFALLRQRSNFQTDFSNLRYEDADWKSPWTVAGLIRAGTDTVGQWTVTFKKQVGPTYAALERKSKQIKGEAKAEPTVERKEKPMARQTYRSLYAVFVVDPETDAIFDAGLFIAKSTESAKYKALKALGDQIAKEIDDYDFAVQELCCVRDKKEVQEVKIVGS